MKNFLRILLAIFAGLGFGKASQYGGGVNYLDSVSIGASTVAGYVAQVQPAINVAVLQSLQQPTGVDYSNGDVAAQPSNLYAAPVYLPALLPKPVIPLNPIAPSYNNGLNYGGPQPGQAYAPILEAPTQAPRVLQPPTFYAPALLPPQIAQPTSFGYGLAPIISPIPPPLPPSPLVHPPISSPILSTPVYNSLPISQPISPPILPPPVVVEPQPAYGLISPTVPSPPSPLVHPPISSPILSTPVYNSSPISQPILPPILPPPVIVQPQPAYGLISPTVPSPPLLPAPIYSASPITPPAVLPPSILPAPTYNKPAPAPAPNPPTYPLPPKPMPPAPQPPKPQPPPPPPPTLPPVISPTLSPSYYNINKSIKK